jgi:translocation and assembly module TamB
MPVDDQEGRAGAQEEGREDGARADDAGGEGASELPREPPPSPAPARRRRRGWRRVVSRRNAAITAVVAVVAVVLLVIVALLLYRTGQIDRVIAEQIKTTLAEYGVRAEIREFRTRFGPRSAEMLGVELYDAQTGERIGKIDRLVATVRVEDMWALNLRRDVNLESLEIDGLELWVHFDEQGRSNFRNLRLPPPGESRRINFSYSTARVQLRDSVVHYGDERHEISGEARNLRATVIPDDPSAPAESRMNRVELAFDNSTFTYDGHAVNNISVEAKARVDQVRAEIQELVLRSPVAEARLEGALDDWRSLRYRMRVTSSVDLTEISNVFRPETTLRGAGRFTGTVEGEGDRFTVTGAAESDALAAGNIRLKNLNVQIDRATGRGAEAYEAQGRAVAELLTAGDFQLNLLQVRGGVMGTGTDFRFLGELRAAAARSGETSIANLILSDAAAELKDGEVTATAARATAGAINASGARIEGAQVAGLRVQLRDERNFTGSAASVSTGAVVARDTRIGGVTASNVRAEARGGVTNVVTDSVRVGAGTVAGARLGSINVAGVRLAIHESGRVEGSTADINLGTVAFTTGRGGGGRAQAASVQGRAENVRLARPVFVLEPSGRYRASADLSLGGGVLGEVPLGAARAGVVATNDEIRLNNFSAEALRGRAAGDAVINTARGASRVNANFEGLDVGGLLALATGRAVPVAGATTGSVSLTFPGTDFERASGTLTARFTGETGSEVSGRTPLTGELSLRADRGLFQIERANLRAGASELSAAGRFSFSGDSDLRINLTSADASELQRVVVATNLIPALESALEDSGVTLAGRLEFDGTVRGPLEDPIVNGRASVASLTVNGRDMGTLTATVQSDASATRIPDGLLVARDGGRAQFDLTVPRAGTDNVTLNASLERYDLGAIIAAAQRRRSFIDDDASDLGAQLAGVGPTSGRVNVTGLPGAMSGSADLRAGPGQIRGEPFDEIVARATFDGSAVRLDTLDARFRSGRVTAAGQLGIGVLSPQLSNNTSFDLSVKGGNVRLDVVEALFGGGRLPRLGGTADFTAQAAGDTRDPRSYRITLDGEGRDVIINGQRAGALRLVGRTENQQFNLQLTTGIFGEPQVLTASVDLSSEKLPTRISTSLANVDLSNLFAALLPNANVKVAGRATGTIEAEGSLLGEEGFGVAGLRGTARFSQFVVQIEDVQLAAEDPLIVQFSPNEVTFDRTRFTGPSTNLTFGGTAALGEGGRQNFTVNGDLNLRVLNGLSRNNFFAGVAKVEVRVGGTFADPDVTGLATVSNATISALVEDERLTLQNINGAVRFTADRAEIQSLAGNLGGGRVNVTGGALLDGFTPTQFRFSVRGDQITVPFPEDFRSTADADLVVQGDLRTQQIISGTVNLRRAEYTRDIEIADLIDRRREASITEGVGGEGGFGSNVRLDLRVEGRDALVVRNNLADAVGSVSLQLRGPAAEPVISGRVTLTRGTINFIRGQRYEVTRAIIDLPPRQELDPVLNVQAEGEIRGYRVLVSINGPLSQPSATVRSEPGLPQADVIALITTGNLSAGGEGQSTLAQTGFGTAASLLSETLISQPVSRATDRLFGLNRFEIDPLVAGRGGASPTARLTVGRQINRNLSLTYSTNVTADQNQVLALEYRVSDRLSFVAQYQQGAVNTLRTQRDSFSFEIRFRKRF